MSKRKKLLLGVLIILAMIMGTGIAAYPVLASVYAESVRSEIHSDYISAIENEDDSQLEAARAAAEEWNRALAAGEFDPLRPEDNGYYDQLSIGSGTVMCYVTIPKINVTLPVYHGVSDAVLKKGAGHMPQSSLPIGGEGTHTVISAHSGMAGDPMFSDLELLEVGDIFYIEILGETLTYEVESIQTVLPVEIDALQRQRGRDLATLITCTPYGVNTHRLLVTGHRIETPEEPEEAVEEIQQTTDTPSVWLTYYVKALFAGLLLAILLFLLALVLLRHRRKKHQK